MMQITDDWLTNPTAQEVCHLLTDAGYQALFVGGCVRNALLGAPVTDYDIATDATPDTVMALAQAKTIKSVPTGAEHGTVTVVHGGLPFEITTFRRDIQTDGRHAIVAFSTEVSADAARRDFTMNALYAQPDGTVLDPLGGLSDLHARRVRFIGDPAQRIAEDRLRILRFFRFTAWYGAPDAGFDPDGLAACAEAADGLSQLSVERITAEFLKLLAAKDPAPALATMQRSGILMRVLPGSDASILPVLVHLEGGADQPPAAMRRLAALGGQPQDALRLSRAQARHLAVLRSDQTAVEASYRHGSAVGIDRLLLERAATATPVTPADIERLFWAATQQFPLKAADFPLSGPDLGQALKTAEARWIASDFSLTRDDLLG